MLLFTIQNIRFSDLFNDGRRRETTRRCGQVAEALPRVDPLQRKQTPHSNRAFSGQQSIITKKFKEYSI